MKASILIAIAGIFTPNFLVLTARPGEVKIKKILAEGRLP